MMYNTFVRRHNGFQGHIRLLRFLISRDLEIEAGVHDLQILSHEFYSREGECELFIQNFGMRQPGGGSRVASGGGTKNC